MIYLHWVDVSLIRGDPDTTAYYTMFSDLSTLEGFASRCTAYRSPPLYRCWQAAVLIFWDGRRGLFVPGQELVRRLCRELADPKSLIPPPVPENSTLWLAETVHHHLVLSFLDWVAS